MNGERVTRRGTVLGETGTPAFVGPPWTFVGTGESSTGEDDTLYHNTASDGLQFWYPDGPRIKGSNGVVDERGNAIRIGTLWNVVGDRSRTPWSPAHA